MIKDEEIETDLDFLTLPPDMAPEGETFEFRFGGPDWKRGFRYGKVWLYDGDFVGRLSETTEVRIPATWIRAAVDELVATLAWGTPGAGIEGCDPGCPRRRAGPFML